MSNAYNNASLIVPAANYEAGTIFSLVPTDGSGDLSFTRAGSKMVRNSSGLWETIGTNIPPLHYPVGGGCPSWLFEAEATNVIEYSETLQNCGTEATTITPNAAISPRGTMTAASMLETNVTTNHDIFRFINITIGTKYTQSIRVKPNGRTWAVFVFLGISGGFAYQKVWFNLTGAGSVGTQQAGIDNASIELDSEGYYFIQATATALATVNEAFVVGIADADNNTNYAGDITKGLYTWNYQIETGSVATSPIITAGSSVTRLKDVPSKTGISALIGQTEGTIFVDVVINSENNPFANIINGAKNTNSSFSIVRVKATKAIRASVSNSAIIKADISGGSYNLGDRLKIAYGYKSGDSVLYVNGVQIGTSADAISFPATLSELNWDDATTYFGYQEAENINETRISKTRLPNAELAALTTI